MLLECGDKASVTVQVFTLCSTLFTTIRMFVLYLLWYCMYLFILRLDSGSHTKAEID